LSAEPVIEARELTKHFPVRRGLLASLFSRHPPKMLRAVDGVSFALNEGDVLGLAGESGCGKSTTGMTLLNLYPPTSGEIHFRGLGRLDGADKKTLLAFRRQAQIVFQNPYETLNPRYTIEHCVREPIAIHFPGDAKSMHDRVVRAMTRAGLTPVEQYVDRYPHQLSGGQLQRVAIARAIAVEPRVLVADEPVSMLDVSIRAGILNLLRSFAAELNMAVLYISHDLSTMRHICTEIAVMYLGRIIERGPADAVLAAPRHPYAQALVASVPVMGGRGKRQRTRLIGAIPNAADIPEGCRFHPRCPKAMARCLETEPELKPQPDGRLVACHLYD
jgi:oligopeptide/dipeptide ABC transporter ATP-binding protein